MTIEHNTPEGREERLQSFLRGDLEDALKALDALQEHTDLTFSEWDVIDTAIIQLDRIQINRGWA